MLIDLAAVFLDNLIEPRPKLIDDIRHIFRVFVFGESGKTGNIGKYYSDQLPARVSRRILLGSLFFEFGYLST